MSPNCARCGFQDETLFPLPDAWLDYLVEERGFDSPAADTVGFPICSSCKWSLDDYLGPDQPGSRDSVDAYIRSYLDELEPGDLRSLDG